jgi:PGF-pre-PGF domain-containing protein
MKQTTKKTTFASILLVLTLIILLPVISANQPTPKGIEGTVYHLDGLTQVFEGIPVIITNLNNSQQIIAHTGRGTSGRYSSVVNWNNGDLLNVFVSNPVYNDSVNITLNGAMRGVDLFLNMDLPNIPPNITSNPVVEAFENVLYNYQVTAFDWNLDEINYGLISYPENMNISSTGEINWIPTRDQYGLHEVVVNVSDGQNDTIHSFEIEVFISITPANIQSTPKTSVLRGETYKYELIVLDEDPSFLTYEVFRGAPNMTFEENKLIYTPSAEDSGTYIVILDVYNRFENRSRQIFFLDIIEPAPKRQGSTSPIIREVQIPRSVVSSITEFLIPNQQILGLITIKNDKQLVLEFEKTNLLTQKATPPSTRVFEYFTLKANESISEEVIIQFFVNFSQIETLGLNPSDVVLIKYADGSWIELQTKQIKNNDSNILTFEAISPGLSLFAISHKKGVETLRPEVTSNVIEAVFLINGKISFIDENNNIILSKKNQEKLKNHLEITLTNKRLKQNYSASFVHLSELFYQSAVNGQVGDELLLSVSFQSNTIFEKNLILSNQIFEENIVLDYEIIKSFINKNTYLYLAGGLVIILTLVILMIKAKKYSKR